jgi:hypothetical protein
METGEQLLNSGDFWVTDGKQLGMIGPSERARANRSKFETAERQCHSLSRHVWHCQAVMLISHTSVH